MSNILIVPDSGSIYFTTGSAGSSAIPNLSSGVAFKFDNSAGVNITSYATGVSDNDRFSIDGYNGRLFNVSDNLTGIIFSVNDGAGLPIIEVDSGAVDKVTMGTYGTNTFVIDGNKVGIGTGVPAAKLDIFDNVLAGSAGLAGSALNISQTWNTTGTPSAIKLNVTDTASNAASNLLELWSNNIKRFEVRKDGNFFNAFSFVFGPSTTSIRGQLGGNGLGLSSLASISWAPLSNYGSVGDVYNVADLRILRESAGVLAQRNGSNPQEFRLYNTSTSSTNFERLNLKWDTNVLKIGTEKGTEGGVARAMEFQTDGTTRMTIKEDGNVGIGTTTPTQKLEISGGNILSSGTVTGTSGLRLGVSTAIQTANGGAITWGSMNSSGGNTLTFSGFTDSIFFNSQVSMGSNRFNLAGGYIQSITTGGPNNVPTMLFSASQGSDAGNPIFRFTSGSNYTEHRLFGVGSGVTYTEHLTVISNGKVGIGTTTPAARLDIVDSTLAGSGSLAGSVLNIAQTWNTTGAPTAIKLNVTNTASGAASNLLDLQVGGTSMFQVNKSGELILNSSASATSSIVLGGYSLGNRPTISNGGQNGFLFLINSVNHMGLNQPGNGGLTLASDVPLNWSSNSTVYLPTVNVSLIPDGAGQLAMRNGINPQTFRLYNTYTDNTTFERLDIKWDTNVLRIGTEKGNVGGTGRSLKIGAGTGFLNFDYNGTVTLQGSGEAQDVYIQGAGNASLYLKSSGNRSLFIEAANAYTHITRSSGSSTANTPILRINQTDGSAFAFYSKTNSSVDTELSMLGNSSYLRKIIFGGSGAAGGIIGTDVHIKGGLAGTNTLRCGDVYVYGMTSLGTGRSGHVVLQHDSSVATNGNVGIGTLDPTEKLHVLGNIRNVGNLSIYNSDIVTTLDRLTVDGSQGRLFTVTDSLVGSLMSVNDIAGLPILEVFDDDKIVMGEYASNALTVLGKNVGIGTGSPTAKLDILDTVLAGSGSLAGSALNIAQTWNTSGTPTAIKLNVTDTTSNAASKLLDLQVSGVSKATVDKGGVAMFLKAIAYDPASTQSSNVNGFQLSSPQFAGIHGLFSRYNSSSEGWVLKSNGAGQIAGTINWEGPFVNQHIGFAAGATQAVNPSTFLWGTPSNTLEQRNGVNPQKFTLYNTYTSSTNFERLNLRWDTNVVKIGTEKGSAGGVARDLVFETDGTERARITAAGLFSANGVPFGKGGGNVDTNIAIGLGSLASNINGFNGAGQNNTAIGYNALLDNTDGYDNVAIGSLSLSNNTTGRETIAIGKNSLINSVNGISNIGIGLNSLQYSVSTQSNIGLGNNALDRNTNGNANIAIGHSAGSQAVGFFQYITAVEQSIFLGTATKAYSTTGNTNLIVIGYQAQALLSNSVVLGNNNITDTYLKGTAQIHRLNADPVNYERIAMRWNGTTGTLGTSQLGTGSARDLALETSGTPRMTVTSSGNIGIGTITPNSKLTVTSGDIEITDTTAGVIFKTPDGTNRYRMTIDNAGAPVFTLLV